MLAASATSALCSDFKNPSDRWHRVRLRRGVEGEAEALLWQRLRHIHDGFWRELKRHVIFFGGTFGAGVSITIFSLFSLYI